MTRLIDADALMKVYAPHEFMSDMGDAMEILANFPTVDAVPVKHGKWELAEDGWYCSACELYPPFDCDPEEKGIPYCPNCGARMDERKSE